jgi:adenosylcobinamide kinase/adenosylcobinamide-phosphate guanylyltransferase
MVEMPPTQPKIVLVGGGARSGKSRFALAYAQKLGARRIFVATAQALDDEMKDRIRRHQDERGSTFQTIEEPVHLAQALKQAGTADVVLVDCLTLWLSNLLLQGLAREAIADAIEEVLAVLRLRRHPTVLVSNEVGMGLVPESPLGRAFRDIVGLAHQRLTAEADEVYLAAMGLVVRLLPAPTVAFRPSELPEPCRSFLPSASEDE